LSSKTKLKLEVPETKALDGSLIQAVTAEFANESGKLLMIAVVALSEFYTNFQRDVILLSRFYSKNVLLARLINCFRQF
jgi:hypothetical protein